jgi:hypothetical protein
LLDVALSLISFVLVTYIATVGLFFNRVASSYEQLNEDEDTSTDTHSAANKTPLVSLYAERMTKSPSHLIPTVAT